MYDCFRAYPTRPFFDLYVHVSLRSAIRHADRFAAFGCSLSRRSPYTYKSKSFRFRASSTRPFFDLYVHGSLLRAKKACPCSFIHLLLGQADKYHPAVPPGLTLFCAHSAIRRDASSIKNCCIPTYAELCLRRSITPSPILYRSVFQVALRSPFGNTLHTAISAPAVLWNEGSIAYSLFFNGLTQCSMDYPEVSMF